MARGHIKIALSAVALLLLSGCVATSEGYRQQMALNVGMTGTQLQSEWGAPDLQIPLSNGSNLWIYRVATPHETGGYSTQGYYTRTEEYIDKKGKKQERSETLGSDTFFLEYYEWVTRCETRFEVGGDNRVKSVHFEGEDCRAQKPRKRAGNEQ